MKSVEERLRELPEIAEESGIEAGEALRRRILRSAEGKRNRARNPRLTIAAALCCAALVLAGVYALPRLNEKRAPSMVMSQSAGGDWADSMAANEESAPGGARALLDVKNGSVRISASGRSSTQSIWAKADGGNFPLIAAEGRYYRLLTEPASVSEKILGDSLGTVAEHTAEPALYTGNGIVSNLAAQGESVYEVKGMKGALVSAKIDGVWRVFQRVSYSGNAIIGREKLGDTLKASQIESIELAGVGKAEGEDAKALYSLLTENAQYQNSVCQESGENILITLTNGIVLQLAVNGETVSACGTWACSEFFEAFEGR